MRYWITLLIIWLPRLAVSQSGIPGFLHGNWKMENEEVYEHWDKLNDSTMKGFSYIMEDGAFTVIEYMEIARRGDETHYKANVLNQNQGETILFTLTKTDSAYTFENPAHDFPKMIVYQELSDTELLIRISDGRQQGILLRMQRQPAGVFQPQSP